MNAVKFPNMISANKTNITKDIDATRQNLKLLLLSDKGTLMGDPYFGSNLKKLLYEYNNVILKDLVIDDIFSAINTFMPQIRVLRENINVIAQGNTVRVTITAQNLLDYSFAEYEVNLLSVEEM